MNKLSKRLLIDSYGGAHKITCPIQISIPKKNLMSDLKYDIILIVLGSRKVAEWTLKWTGPTQCCATFDMAHFDFEAEILVHNKG